MLKCRVLCGNPLQRFGSGLDPDPEPNRDFGPVANSTKIGAIFVVFGGNPLVNSFSVYYHGTQIFIGDAMYYESEYC